MVAAFLVTIHRGHFNWSRIWWRSESVTAGNVPPLGAGNKINDWKTINFLEWINAESVPDSSARWNNKTKVRKPVKKDRTRNERIRVIKNLWSFQRVWSKGNSKLCTALLYQKKAKIWETNCRKNYDQLEWKSIPDGFKKIIFGPFSQNFPHFCLTEMIKKSYTHAWQLCIKCFKKLKINRIVGSKKSA